MTKSLYIKWTMAVLAVLAISCSQRQEAALMADDLLAQAGDVAALDSAWSRLEQKAATHRCIVAVNSDTDPDFALLQATLDADADSLLEAEYDALVSPSVTIDDAPLVVLCDNWSHPDSLRLGNAGRHLDARSLARGCAPCFTPQGHALWNALRQGKEMLTHTIATRLSTMSDHTKRDREGHAIEVSDNLTNLHNDLNAAATVAQHLTADRSIALVSCDYIVLPKSHLDGTFDSGYTRATVTLFRPATGKADSTFTVYAANSDRIAGNNLLENLRLNLLRHVALRTPRH